MPEQTSEIQLEMKDTEPEEGTAEKEQDGETKALVNELEGDDNKKKEPYDAMRNEPHLVNLIVESYLGEQDERGFFHGIGTAYFKGNHVYSGSFVDGLMDGTGQYIWSNGIKYEGDFKNNMIEGRGIYTWPDESTYDGDVLSGLRHGQGTYVCGTIPSSYTGEWKYGKRSGEGILRYDKEGLSYYDGHWMDNRRHGFGMRRYASGNIYKGDWRENVRHGTGTMHWYDKNERYEGQWENGIQHGHGEHSWFLKRIAGSQYPLRNYYVGEWVNGMRHGHGTFYYATGAKYVGEWMNNMKHGSGKYVFKNGMVFEGKSCVMFKKRAAVFYKVLNHKMQPSGFRPDKTHAARFLNGFTNIPGKTCVNSAHNNYAFVNVGNLHTRKTPHTNVFYQLIKHCILMRSVLSAVKTPHTNEKEVYRYKVTAHDVLSTI